MSEETLNNLFKQARNQTPETTIDDIKKWVEIGSSLTITALVLLKVKWLITHKIGIMMTTLMTVGLTVTAIISINRSNENLEKAVSERKIKTENRLFSKKTETKPIVDDFAFKPKDNAISKVIENQEENKDSKFEMIPFLPILPTSNTPQNLHAVTPKVNMKFDNQNFTSIKISGASEVVLIQGNECNVRVEGDSLGKCLASIDNKNGTLFISTKSNKGKKYKLKFYITVNQLERLDVSGASEISSEGILNQSDLIIKSSGASEINLNLENNSLDMISTGASEIKLKGHCANFILDASGASELKAIEYEVQKANIKCYGASELKIFVSKELNLDLSGASDIKCKGNPTIGKKSVTGASDFKMIL